MTDALRYTAFSTVPHGGNPAGVVLDASSLADDEMLAVAAELGYSESAFAIPSGDGDRAYVLRYFSPLAEVDFCGHATIAAAVAIAEHTGPGDIRFDTKGGLVAVATRRGEDGTTTATLTSPPASSRPARPDELDPLLAALRWSADELDPSFPPHVASAGNNHPVLVASTRERLAALDYDFDALSRLMAEQDWTTVQLVWPEREDLVHARDPFPPGGIVEDPATGAAAAAFGGYLRTLGRLPADGRLTILQGEDMGRPSRLEVEVPPTGGVRVSGPAVPID